MSQGVVQQIAREDEGFKGRCGVHNNCIFKESERDSPQVATCSWVIGAETHILQAGHGIR